MSFFFFLSFLVPYYFLVYKFILNQRVNIRARTRAHLPFHTGQRLIEFLGLPSGPMQADSSLGESKTVSEPPKSRPDYTLAVRRFQEASAMEYMRSYAVRALVLAARGDSLLDSLGSMGQRLCFLSFFLPKNLC